MTTPGDPDARDYSDNERRLLTIAAQRQMLLDEAAKAAAETIRELTEEIRRRDATIAERDARLQEIANRAANAHSDEDDPLVVIQDIAAMARGETPG